MSVNDKKPSTIKARKSYEAEQAEKKQQRKLQKEEMSRRERQQANKEEKREKKKQRARNKEFARVTYLFVILFLGMMSYIVYFQLEKSSDFTQSAYNQRLKNLEEKIVKGSILDRNNNILAKTVTINGEETRNYPYNDVFAHVVGYSANGTTGLEASKSSTLLTSNEFILDKMKNQFKGQKNYGDDIVTTLDVQLQQNAYDALGDSKGAVIALNPKNGEILAMVSKPCFDPNTVAEDWDDLSGSEDGILLNRVTQGQYAPGSTFKLVTLLEYLKENPNNYEDYSYDCTGEIEAGNNTIHCFDGEAHGRVDLRDSLAYSCNTSFSNLSTTLDLGEFQDTAKQLLFNSKLPCELTTKKSSFTLGKDAGTAERMMTAIGQGNTEISPYHLALIASAIANDGLLMKPHLVKNVVNHAGTVISTTKTKEYKELMSSDEASVILDYMTSVTEYGTAKTFNGSGYSVAGKTGTAEYSSDKEKDHSWFVGITSVENPELVICVVIEAADGTSRAVNIAKEIFDEYYN